MAGLLITGLVWIATGILIGSVFVICPIGCVLFPFLAGVYTAIGYPIQRRFFENTSAGQRAFEAAVIAAFLKEHPSITCTVRTDDLYLNDEYGTIHPHTLFFSGPNPAPKKNLFLIHGVLAQPIGWKAVIPQLCEAGYRVYCPGLPGFGMVPLPDGAWSFTTSDWLHFYSFFLKELIGRICPDEKPDLLGHSFGGNVCMHFCSTYPDLFHELILLNPMSMLPTLHELTPFFGIVFNHFPFYVVRAFGSILNGCVLPLLQDNPFLVSEWTLLTCRENVGNVIVSRFVCVEAIKSYWKGPYCFTKLLPLAHRIHAICSEGDLLSASQNLKLFFGVTNKQHHSVYITSGGGHNPSRDCPEEFMNALHHIWNRRELPMEPFEPPFLAEETFDTIIQEYGWCVFDLKMCRQNIQKCHSAIRAAVAPATPFFYYKVNGTEITWQSESDREDCVADSGIPT